MTTTSRSAVPDLRCDAFLGGRVQLWQPVRGYRAGVDPVLLAASVPARAGQSLLDLGCGAGAAGLCLAARVDGVEVIGLERQSAYAQLARRNGLNVIEADLGQMPPALKARSFDHVIANPPYFDRARGARAQDPGRESALGEETPLDMWIAAGAKRLRHLGYMHVVLPPQRMDDLLAACAGRLGSVEILPLSPRTGREPGLIIARARKGGAAPLRLHFPRIMHQGSHHIRDGEDYSPEFANILRNAAPLDF